MTAFLAGGAVALLLALAILWRAARLILRNWLNGADGMALFTSPALEAAKALIGSWWKLGAGAIVGAALALPVGQCQGADAERARQAARTAKAETAAVAANAGRIERQAERREAATAEITEAKKGRSDAIHAGPDAPTAGPDCRALRQRMLRDGWRDADLPSCR